MPFRQNKERKCETEKRKSRQRNKTINESKLYEKERTKQKRRKNLCKKGQRKADDSQAVRNKNRTSGEVYSDMLLTLFTRYTFHHREYERKVPSF